MAHIEHKQLRVDSDAAVAAAADAREAAAAEAAARAGEHSTYRLAQAESDAALKKLETYADCRLEPSTRTWRDPRHAVGPSCRHRARDVAARAHEAAAQTEAGLRASEAALRGDLEARGEQLRLAAAQVEALQEEVVGLRRMPMWGSNPRPAERAPGPRLRRSGPLPVQAAAPPSSCPAGTTSSSSCCSSRYAAYHPAHSLPGVACPRRVPVTPCPS